MEYEPSDSSGTDDDLPPSHQNRVPRGGHLASNGRPALVGSAPYSRPPNDMETQIHLLEQEAYSSVLRAFKAQSDAITWEKESLITELRKELRVSDEEHRELLGRVNADDIIRMIREWRQAGGAHQPGLLSTAQPVHDQIPSPTVSASRKKQKATQSVPSISLNAPSPALHPQAVGGASMQPSSSSAKRAAAVGARGKTPKSGVLPGVPGMKSIPYPSAGPTGRGQAAIRGTSGALVANETADAAALDLVGRKVLTRWPEDNNFYEAVITNYNASEGRHALVYDMNTKDETWEWVNLKEISIEDIRWEGEDPGISRRAGRSGGLGHGAKKPMGRGGAVPGAGRGRGGLKNQVKKEFPPSQNVLGKKTLEDIEILHTQMLIKEVEERVLGANPDPLEMEKAKKVLKEQEEALLDAIARLVDASDGESDDEHRFSHGQSLDRERGWRNRPYGGNQHSMGFDDDMVEGMGFDDDMVEGRGDGSDGYQLVGEARVAPYDHRDADDL